MIKDLISSSREVITLAPKDETSQELINTGCTFINLKIDKKGLNPITDIQLKNRLTRIYDETAPDLIIHYTIKPVIYGSMAAAKLGIPFVNNITGLGTAFIQENWVTWLVKRLYRFSLKKASYVFFQNRDDQNLFQKEKLIPETVSHEVIPGTGIDTERFSPKTYPSADPVTFLLIARLIWDKGISEYVEAARKIKSVFSNVHFQLLGFLDVENRTAILRQQVEEWVAEGVIEYLGDKEDVRPYIEKASCVVLPSYREGLPRTLLEAAAMARPIITTDVTGCREVVDDGVNGYLCNLKDAEDLAKKIEIFLHLSDEIQAKMGCNGRKKVEQEFDEKIMINRYLKTINEILKKRFA